MLNLPRILLVTGHYGSGKTEFSVSLAVYAAHNGFFGYKKAAIADLDVVNPYFRSREREDMLKELGVDVYGSFFGGSVTAELPEISPTVRTPMEDKDTFTIVDAGGNDAGARVVKQFSKYFRLPDAATAVVINASRPETRDLDGALNHLKAIQDELELTPAFLVNNTHLLTETTAEDVLRGHRLCEAVSKETGIPLLCDCYPERLVKKEELSDIKTPLLPLGMYMRESWLDK